MASTKESVIALTRLTLFTAFAEKDATKRLSMIKDSWVPSGDCLFIDPSGVYKTHESINDMVSNLQKIIDGHELRELSTTPIFYFLLSMRVMLFTNNDVLKCGLTLLGEYVILHPDGSDTWVVNVRWGIGQREGAPNMTGLDVVTIVEGKMKAVYTFIDGQS